MITVGTSKMAAIALAMAILPCPDGGRAAEEAYDAQRLARDLLSHTDPSETKAFDTSSAVPATANPTHGPDAQDQARQLILGAPISTSTTSRTPSALLRSATAVYADPQDAARRMILAAKSEPNKPAEMRSIRLLDDRRP
jgi:hypothetical protein